jgi:uncharacterized ParB-like nuclease family protein
MCTRDKDIYSCGCTKKEYPFREFPHKRWGRPCPYDILVNTYQGNYPCAGCHRIKALEDRKRMLEDDIVRLRAKNGSRHRDRARERQRLELRSRIDDLEKSRRVWFEI